MRTEVIKDQVSEGISAGIDLSEGPKALVAANRN